MISRIKGAIRRKIVNYFREAISTQQIYRCNVNGCLVLLEVGSKIEKFRADTYATKEPETLEWIERYIQPGDVMYDIGANIGLYSLFAAKRLHRQCKIYAFEPEALNHAQLSRNIYLNGLSGVVLPCCVAVTDKLCFDIFYLNPENFNKMAEGQCLVPGSAIHSFGDPEDYNGKSFLPFHTQGTVGVPLDHLWREWGLNFPNHVKIDVDGLEEKIISGAALTLEDRRLKSVLVEVSTKKTSLDLIMQQLTQAGFTQVTDFAAHSSELLKGTPYEGSVNYVFIREL